MYISSSLPFRVAECLLFSRVDRFLSFCFRFTNQFSTLHQNQLHILMAPLRLYKRCLGSTTMSSYSGFCHFVFCEGIVEHTPTPAPTLAFSSASFLAFSSASFLAFSSASSAFSTFPAFCNLSATSLQYCQRTSGVNIHSRSK